MEMNKQNFLHNQKMKGGSKNMEKMYTMLVIAFLVIGTSGFALADTSVTSVEASEPGFFKNAWNKFKATFGFKETKQANLANKIAQLKDVGASEKAINAAQINYNKLNAKFTAVKVNGASPTNPLEKPLFDKEFSVDSQFWRSILNRIQNSDLSAEDKAQLFKRIRNALFDSDNSFEDTLSDSNEEIAWRAILNRIQNADLSDKQKAELFQRFRAALYGSDDPETNPTVSYEVLEAELIELQKPTNEVSELNLLEKPLVQDQGSNGNGIDIARWRSIYNRIINSGFSDYQIDRLLYRFYNALEGHGYNFDFENDNEVKPIKLTSFTATKVANQNVISAQ